MSAVITPQYGNLPEIYFLFVCSSALSVPL